ASPTRASSLITSSASSASRQGSSRRPQVSLSRPQIPPRSRRATPCTIAHERGGWVTNTPVGSVNPIARGETFMAKPESSSAVHNSIDRAAFENFYAGPAPWDIGKPQPAFTAVADQVTGPILDAGCGTGEHALYFAARGHTVVGIDFVDEAIRRARAK